MDVSLDKVCDYLRKWGDLSLTEMREMLAKRLGDPKSTYRKHSRGELLALMMSDYPNWDGKAAVCPR